MPRTRSSVSSGESSRRPRAPARPGIRTEPLETALLVLGVFLSVVWLLLCGWLVATRGPGFGREASLLDLAVLAAGATAPLTLLWAVLLFGLGGLRGRADARASALEIERLAERRESPLPDERLLQGLKSEMSALLKETQRLDERLADIRSNVRKLDLGLAKESDRLLEASAVAAERSEALRAALEEASAAQAAGSAAAEAASRRLEERLSAGTQRLAALAGSLDSALAGLPKTIETRSEQLDRSLAQAEGIVGRLETAFTTRVEQVERIARDLGAQAEAIRDTLAEQPAGLLVTAEGALATARQVSQAFDDEGRRLREIAALCKRHAQELQLAADEAGKAQLRLQMSDLESRRDLFLRTASQLLQDLNSSALELDRAFEAEVPEELWRKWQSGDRGVFLRRLLKRRATPEGPQPLIERYRGDEAFRNQAERYLDRFESLMNQAALCDPENILTAAFMTSDVGKLYLLLARAAGRRR